MSAAASIEEARSLAHRLVQFEKGRCGGDTALAIFNAASVWDVEESALRMLRYRSRSLTYVKAHILDRLRQADAIIQERAKREREILRETAEALERHGHPAARLARMAAEAAGEAPRALTSEAPAPTARRGTALPTT
ncbi:MAG: hypothetical protein AB7I42_26535 [Bradyrhizobium sp.]|uniref:hypothetical protein n=1 Tax=Bradyrhizobium sp. TaxID=376 RepID=UPI003D0B14CB